MRPLQGLKPRLEEVEVHGEKKKHQKLCRTIQIERQTFEGRHDD